MQFTLGGDNLTVLVSPDNGAVVGVIAILRELGLHHQLFNELIPQLVDSGLPILHVQVRRENMLYQKGAKL